MSERFQNVCVRSANDCCKFCCVHFNECTVSTNITEGGITPSFDI